MIMELFTQAILMEILIKLVQKKVKDIILIFLGIPKILIKKMMKDILLEIMNIYIYLIRFYYQ